MTHPEVTWGEPQNMPTGIELEPVTGKALQEFGLPKRRVQPAENGFRWSNPGMRWSRREQVLGLMRAIICQLAFSTDMSRLIVG